MPRSKIPAPLASGLLAFGIIFLSAVTMVSAFYLDKVYPGVKVSGINVGGLSRQQVESKLAAKAAEYRLHISVEGKSYELSPQDLGAQYDLNATADMAFARGRNSFAPLALWRSGGDIGFAYAVDRGKLKDFIGQLTVGSSQAPVDATVVMVAGKPQVQPEKNGVGLNRDHAEAMIESALADQSGQVVLQSESIPAEVKAADTTQAVADASQLVARHVELDYQNRTFVPSAAIIGNWLSFVKDGSKLKTVVDTGKIQGWTQTINDAIYVAPKNHLINTVNGQTTGEEQGVNGLAVDEGALAGSIAGAMTAGQSNIVLTVPTVTVPFRTVYNRTINLDFGRYIEVNLSMQHLWVYQDHQVIFDSPLTSGATGAGFPTIQGLFSIYNKQTNRYLNGHDLGYNYDVYVQYWMPFSGNYGLHDASWRSSFGGQDYYYGGSHGCINLPLSTAAWLYGWADIGTPVWVHG